ncbi:MAG: GerMN domain-containing protein [Bacilli bacterium]
MLKKISVRKIIVTTTFLVALLLIYLIPNSNYGLTNKIKEKLEYVNDNVLTSPIYLLNSHNLLARTNIAVSSLENSIELRARELLEALITEGSGESKIPSGFKSVIPSCAKILSIKYDREVLKVDFSKELLEVSKEKEEKIIEAIIYTLTSIKDVDKVIVYVEGDILSKLPQTKINLPSTLTREFGINKEYAINSTKNINQVTVYYLDEYNDQTYYVPVTKYLNDDREKIKIIIEQLASTSLYHTNLMSYLNNNTELLSVNNENDILNLKFNSYIFDDIDEQSILEEVIYTICLSINDNYNVKEVIFTVDDHEIYKSVLKTIE